MIAQRPRLRKGTPSLQPLACLPAGRQGVLFSPEVAPNVKLAQSCVHASITLTDAALGTPSVRRQCTPAKRCKFCSFDVGYPLSDLDTESGPRDDVGSSRPPPSMQRHRRGTFRVIIQPRTCHLEGVSFEKCEKTMPYSLKILSKQAYPTRLSRAQPRRRQHASRKGLGQPPRPPRPHAKEEHGGGFAALARCVG